MPKTKHALIWLTSAGVLVCGGASAVAAPAHHRHAGGHARGNRVTGRLSARGYTIVAVGTNGKITSSKARSFSLRAPASQYTLQLINSRGQYAGPVVVSGGSRKVIVGLKGGVKLGAIHLVSAKGYAHVVRHVPAASLVRSRWAWAKHGVPIGNGRNFGLVVSPTKGTGPAGAGADSDRSGIANVFDIAPGGNGIIKSLVPAGTRAHLAGDAPALAPAPGNGAASTWMSQLFLAIESTINDDAAGVTTAEIDSALSANLNLKLLNLPVADRLELDCNGLSFCSQGGTGQAAEEGQGQSSAGTAGHPGFPEVAFPGATLDPATGFGELVGANVPPGLLGTLAGSGTSEFSLLPNASSAQIGSGDVITEVATSNGATTQTPTTLNFVFNSVPAIAAYSAVRGTPPRPTIPTPPASAPRTTRCGWPQGRTATCA